MSNLVTVTFNRCRAAMLASLVLGSLLPSLAAARPFPKAVDLAEGYGMRVSGAHRVAHAGDVDGDGIADLLVSHGQPLSGPPEGRTYVIFGRTDKRDLDVNALGADGFTIFGAKPTDYASEVVGVGDVNGDGLDDIAVGAPEADNNMRSASGSVYVVFGKSDPAPVHLAAFDAGTQGPMGYRIDGAAPTDLAGRHLSAAHDVNQDGFDDVLLAAPFAGAAYVVFGKTDAAEVDLRDFEDETQNGLGYVIRTHESNRDSDYAVAACPDVNGDNVPDALVAMARNNSRYWAYVIYGKDGSATVNARRPGASGYVINEGYSSLGCAGDVNGDGLDDLYIYSGGGDSYVIFGARRDFGRVLLERLGRRQGFLVDGDNSNYAGAFALGPAGDVNGDGLADVIAAYSNANFNGRTESGSAYVVFGKADKRTVPLRRIRRHGFRIDGPAAGSGIGSSVAALGDVSGDGKGDVFVGAERENAAYAVWGR